MQFNSLFGLKDCHVKLSLADIVVFLVTHLIERQQLGVIIRGRRFLLLCSLDKGLTAVEIHIVAGVERLPPTGGGGVLLGGAST